MPTKPFLTESCRTSDAVIRVLEEAGIDKVFGMAGGHTGRLFTSLSRFTNSITTYTMREESLASVMAEVYGRLTRKPGVLIGQGAWVLGNGIIGTLEAHMSSSPMILLTEFSDSDGFDLHGAYQSGKGAYGSWDARQAFSAITKHVFEAHDPVSAVQATQFAVKHALSGQPGPVAVLFSDSSLRGAVQPESRPRLYSTGAYLPPTPGLPKEAALAAAAEQIAKAALPILIAGNGVRLSNAYETLRGFADQTGLPVVTSTSGKGVFPETHPLSLAVYGNVGHKGANHAVGEADLVLVAGSKLGATDTARQNPALLDASRQTIIQIDVEPRNASWTLPADQVLIGDAGQILDGLAQGMARLGAPRHAGEARVAGIRGAFGYFNGPEYGSEQTPILPQRTLGALRDHLPVDAIVTCDAGENRLFMTHFYQTRGTCDFLQAAGAGPMGFAIPAALGAKLLYPERTVVAVCGDGGFAMTMNGLMSAIEHKIPIIVLVLNNSALGWVFHGSGEFAQKFNDFDLSAIARAMGCDGARVTRPDELESAIKGAVASRRPTVIDVVSSLEVSYQDVMSPLMA